VYLYTLIGNKWSFIDKLVAADAVAGDYFGSSVSMSSEYGFVGALFRDTAFEDAGALRCFLLKFELY
jgi:hypothetical protein